MALGRALLRPAYPAKQGKVSENRVDFEENSGRIVVFRPSRPGERRGGRPKGGKNKVTLEILKAVEYAFKGIGGKKRLKEWADENPELFFTRILPRFIPQQMNLADADGNKLEPIRIIRIVAPAPTVPLNGHA